MYYLINILESVYGVYGAYDSLEEAEKALATLPKNEMGWIIVKAVTKDN